VITGFNTDIQYEGVTYHVQTEDKGLDAPVILSLVYVGGAIIASKRTPYEDLLAAGFDNKALTERLQRQHKLICAAIRAGRIADLKRMGGAQGERQDESETHAPGENGRAQRKRRSEAAQEASQNGSGASVGASEASSPVAADVRTEAAAEFTPEVGAEEAGRSGGSGVEAGADEGVAGKSSEGGAGESSANKSSADEIVILTTLVDEIAALGGGTSYQPPTFKAQPVEQVPLHEEFPVASRPVAPPTPTPPRPQPVEVPAPDSSDELYLTLLDDEGDFRAGQLVMIKVHVGRGTYGRRPVADAQVTVKVLGTTFRPLIITGATDATGVAVIRALLPRFTSGRAAIIIRAVSGEDAAEMRRIIHQA
jgi:hypothetical protein